MKNFISHLFTLKAYIFSKQNLHRLIFCSFSFLEFIFPTLELRVFVFGILPLHLNFGKLQWCCLFNSPTVENSSHLDQLTTHI